MKFTKYGKLVTVSAILVVGLVLRVLPAPYSTGSDILQFAGFADTFIRHGLCFYSYATMSSWVTEGWPYNWPYVYGPVWVLVLAGLRSFVRSEVVTEYVGSTYYVYAPMDWVAAVKSVMIASDMIAAILLYVLISRLKGWKAGATGMALFYLNPVTIYVSAIYGMFDSLALSFFLSSLLLIERNHLASGALAAVALLTKQVLLLPVITEGVWQLIKGRRRFVMFVAGAAAASTLLLAPFVLSCPSSIGRMLEAFLYPARVWYVRPLPYSFNGLSSIATYLHDMYGLSTSFLIEYWYIVAVPLYAVVLAYLVRKKDLWVSVCLSYVVFTATYWRVNYQYMVTLVALLTLLLISSRLNYLAKSIVSATIVWAALWTFMYPISWWFKVHVRNPNYEVVSMVDKFSLHVLDYSAYVIYSMVLTALQYIMITYVLFKSRLLSNTQQ